jgi:methionyl-tRNA formyltransferase
MAMRILFAGSDDIALPALSALIDSGALVGVLTNPDCPRGRGRERSPTSIAALAAAKAPGLPLLKPEKLDAALRERVAALNPDILAVFAYGKIFGPKFLSLFPAGGLNVHPSLLPRWRGCSPINAAILAQDRETGVSVQRLALKMDCGDILARKIIPLSGRETGESLSETCSRIGAELLCEALADIEAGREKPEPQDESAATYCGIIKKEDGLIDWKAGAASIDARIRAYLPWPQAFTHFKETRLAILEARAVDTAETEGEGAISSDNSAKPGKVLCLDRKRGILVQTGEGVLAVTRLQLEKKKPLSFKDFLNGARDFLGATLT